MFSLWLSGYFKVGEGARIIIIHYHGTMKQAYLIYSAKAYTRRTPLWRIINGLV